MTDSQLRKSWTGRGERRLAIGSRKVRLGVIGFGRVGQATVELALTRPWIEVVAVVARRLQTDRSRLALQDLRGFDGVRFVTAGSDQFRDARPDVVIVATTSRLDDVFPVLRDAAQSGARSILCTAEELAFIQAHDQAGSAIEDLAGSHGVSIVSAGINPGFVMDRLPLVLSSLAWDITALRVRRVMDASVFGPSVLERLGIGYSRDEFDRGLTSGAIVGHLGFDESLRTLGVSMGLDPGPMRLETRPLIAESDIDVNGRLVASGTTIGVAQQASSTLGSFQASLELVVHGAPASGGLKTIDEIEISGVNDVRLTIEPSCNAVLGTAAQLVNTIPNALVAAPGVYGPGALQVATPWLGMQLPPQVSGALISASDE